MNRYILVCSSSSMKPRLCCMCSHVYMIVGVGVCLLRSVGRVNQHHSDKTPWRQIATPLLSPLPPTPSTCDMWLFSAPSHTSHYRNSISRIISWRACTHRGERVLPVTTLGILVMKLFTVLMGTPSVSSWIRVTMSSICRKSQRTHSSNRHGSWRHTQSRRWHSACSTSAAAWWSHRIFCFDDDAFSSTQMLFYLLLKSGAPVALETTKLCKQYSLYK